MDDNNTINLESNKDDDIINNLNNNNFVREELEKVKIRKTNANTFEKYLNDTGIPTAFQLIFSEIIYKKIPVEDHFSYAAGRLRQIGREVDEIKVKNK